MFRKKERLVLTLVVKNEADIIEDNIYYHLGRGVDHIIVTDNDSVDGTYEILLDLERRGLIYLPKVSHFHQANIVNGMGKLAREKLGATMLIHSDADEFWTPMGYSDLKEAFLATGEDAIYVPSLNVLPTPEYVYKTFPQEKMILVTKPLPTRDLQEDFKEKSFFLLKCFPKVMFSVRNRPRKVALGNHSLEGEEKIKWNDKIVLYHFSIKSATAFKKKIIRYCDALAKFDPSPGAHWHLKTWHKRYLDGEFDDLVRELIPHNLEQIEGLGYRKFDYFSEIRNLAEAKKEQLQKPPKRLKIPFFQT